MIIAFKKCEVFVGDITEECLMAGRGRYYRGVSHGGERSLLQRSDSWRGEVVITEECLMAGRGRYLYRILFCKSAPQAS